MITVMRVNEQHEFYSQSCVASRAPFPAESLLLNKKSCDIDLGLVGGSFSRDYDVITRVFRSRRAKKCIFVLSGTVRE